MKPYYILRKELVFHGGVILRKQKLVIPDCLHRSVLRLAHEGHIGIVKCKARLCIKVWWPHIDSEVSSFISECHSCQTPLNHHQPAPMMPIPMPESPWLSVAVDLCSPFPTEETLLILVDYYSRFPFTEILKSSTSATIISKSFQCMVYQKHSRVTMEDNLHLMKWNLFLKSMVLPILELHHYGPRRMGKLSELIAFLRKLYKLLLPKAVIGNTNWIRFCWATEILPIVRQVKRRLSFFFLGPLRTSYQLFQVLKMSQGTRTQ